MPENILPRTVVVLHDFCHINGGAARIAIDEAVGLAESGLRVIFVGAVGPVGPELENSSVEVICLGQNELINVMRSPLVALQGLWNFKAARSVSTLLETLDPQTTLVHVHGYTKALSTSPARRAVSCGFKVVVTLHDFFSACPNGGLFDYRDNKPCERACLSMSCIARNCDRRSYIHKLYRVARSMCQKYVARFPSCVRHFISLSQKSEALLRPYLSRDAVCYPLENLINVPSSSAVDAGANGYVVAVGRLDHEKGIELLLEAVQRAGVELVLIGDGLLREKAEAVPGVRVTGWLSGAEVRKELRGARCLVFPSLWYETFGLVIGEAASCGVPSIVSDITAAAERVVDGVDGWHMRSGDVDDLVRCLEQTKDDAVVRSAGQAAYDKFWSNPPTYDRHMRELKEIYGKILSAA